MVERRDSHRFETAVPVTISTTQFVSNVTTRAYLINCSRAGGKIVSPVYFQKNEKVMLKIDAIGKTLEINGQILECKESEREKAVPVAFGRIFDALAEGMGIETSCGEEFKARYLAAMGLRARTWQNADTASGEELDRMIAVFEEMRNP